MHGAAGRDGRWREAVEMALTGAAFAVPTRVWLGPEAVAALARRDDGDALLDELTGFGSAAWRTGRTGRRARRRPSSGWTTTP
ncbi:hypothetical protein ASALC70_04469 [Alcanivorax sp. ALC70]|nr:hypothetical protein ASALC70_04469 [Alcanivorax sp. ALC70]